MSTRTTPGDTHDLRATPEESTITLLTRAKSGDAGALDTLLARYLPRLRRWATGRLPRWAREMADTQDLVQDALLQTLKRIDSFEPRHDGALQAYLRQGVMNRIRDELRRAHRRPAPELLDSGHPAAGPSPLEEAIGSETLDRYEQALARLRPADREAVIARVEMDASYEEIADDYLRRGEGLFMHRFDTGDTRLVHAAIEQTAQFGVPFAYSAAGQLAFSGRPRDAWEVASAVWLQEPGGTIRELLRIARPDFVNFVGWTPGGGLLLLRNELTSDGEPSGVTRLWFMYPWWSEPTPLDLAAHAMRDVSLHPGGRQVAFTAGGQTWELWALEGVLTGTQ